MENSKQLKTPFYKEKDFYLSLAKILAQAGIMFGIAYLKRKQRKQ